MKESSAAPAKKRVAVVTGTRAEYGLLRPVIRKLLESDALTPRVLVTGAHLREAYGRTVAEIEADGVPIAARLDILTHGDGPLALPETVADAIGQFSRWFYENRPAALLVLGDRYEIFAAAQAAAMTGVPIAHISGGDVTRSAADEYYRHCITKMAALHFPAARTRPGGWCAWARRRIPCATWAAWGMRTSAPWKKWTWTL